jgi:hypothetical protein
MDTDDPDNRPAGPFLLWLFVVVGAVSALFGAYLYGSEKRFRAGAKEVVAHVVLEAGGRKVVQVRDGERVVEIPVVSSEDTFDMGVGPVPVLFNPESDAVNLRSSSDSQLFGGMMFMGLGSLFVLLGGLALRHRRRGGRLTPQGHDVSG